MLGEGGLWKGCQGLPGGDCGGGSSGLRRRGGWGWGGLFVLFFYVL